MSYSPKKPGKSLQPPDGLLQGRLLNHSEAVLLSRLKTAPPPAAPQGSRSASACALAAASWRATVGDTGSAAAANPAAPPPDAPGSRLRAPGRAGRGQHPRPGSPPRNRQ